MIIDLTGQTVVVAGAARGIGLAIARAFAESKADVFAIDLDVAPLSSLQAEFPGKVDAVTCDIGDYTQLTEIARGKSVDHLVCAAAIGSGIGGFPFWNLEPGDWKRVIDITLMGTVNLLHAFVPNLRIGDTNRKSITLLSSVAGQIGSQTDPPYSACKAAIINFAQCAAKDLAPDGIRVNCLSPGMVKTDLNRSVFEANRENEDQSYEDWAAAKIGKIAPLGRWQEPEEFGAMAVYLASDYAKNITGQTINIDGGQVMHS